MWSLELKVESPPMVSVHQLSGGTTWCSLATSGPP